MPCWTVQKNTVALRGLNPDLLRATLTAMGYTLRDADYLRAQGISGVMAGDRFNDRTSIVMRSDGTIDVCLGIDSRADLSAVTRELQKSYAVQTVKAAAHKFGWNLKQTAENKFAVQRRY